LTSATGAWTSARDPAGFAEGESVRISIRPEAIRLGDAPAEADNRVEGIVHDTVYLGEVAQHQVRLGGDAGCNIKVFDLNPRILARDSEQAATLWVEPRDVVVLKRGTP
jgi:ABC-type Fe3+/spermidine/putrescine transport system ATPase subunit